MKGEIQEIIDGLERYLEDCDSDNIICVGDIKVWFDEKHNYITNIKDKAPSHVNWGARHRNSKKLSVCLFSSLAQLTRTERGGSWVQGQQERSILEIKSP